MTLKFKLGTAEKVLAGIVASIGPTRRETGNNRFDVFRVTVSPETLVIFERWKSKEAPQKHWQLPYTCETLAFFEEHLEDPLIDGKNVLSLSDMSEARTGLHQLQRKGE